jgi:predicted membrane protein
LLWLQISRRFVSQKLTIMEKNRNLKRREEGRMFAGLILICVGAALLLRNTGFPLPYWLFSWPLILILVGIYSGFKHNFKNNSWIILIAVGSFFLIDKVVPGIRLEPYFWPVLIIGIGILFILRPRRDSVLDFSNDANPAGMPGSKFAASTWERKGNDFATDNNDFLRINSVFSGIERNIVSKDFKGGKIAAVFGGVDIDFTQADIKGQVMLKFEVVFGGVKLVVPPHWTVYNEIEGVFHGVDDKRKFNNSTLNAGEEKVLILKGSVVFGGVEIRSY